MLFRSQRYWLRRLLHPLRIIHVEGGYIETRCSRRKAELLRQMFSA